MYFYFCGGDDGIRRSVEVLLNQSKQFIIWTLLYKLVIRTEFNVMFSSLFPSPGTRIIYDRAYLMNLKNSPLGRTPPKDCLPPGIAKNSAPLSVSPKQRTLVVPKKASVPKDDEQFDMDM